MSARPRERDTPRLGARRVPLTQGGCIVLSEAALALGTFAGVAAPRHRRGIPAPRWHGHCWRRTFRERWPFLSKGHSLGSFTSTVSFFPPAWISGFRSSRIFVFSCLI